MSWFYGKILELVILAVCCAGSYAIGYRQAKRGLPEIPQQPSL